MALLVAGSSQGADRAVQIPPEQDFAVKSAGATGIPIQSKVVPAGQSTSTATPTPSVDSTALRLVAPRALSTGEQIKWQVISGGGNRSTSVSYVVSATIGQTAVGSVFSANYKINQGFWQSFSGSGGGCCVPLSIDGRTGNVDGDPGKGVDISDLSALIDFLYISFTLPPCMESANIDGDGGGGVDISDLSGLIDYLYISFTPPAACQ